jgi:hypothetical protein
LEFRKVFNLNFEVWTEFKYWKKPLQRGIGPSPELQYRPGFKPTKLDTRLPSRDCCHRYGAVVAGPTDPAVPRAPPSLSPRVGKARSPPLCFLLHTAACSRSVLHRTATLVSAIANHVQAPRRQTEQMHHATVSSSTRSTIFELESTATPPMKAPFPTTSSSTSRSPSTVVFHRPPTKPMPPRASPTSVVPLRLEGLLQRPTVRPPCWFPLPPTSAAISRHRW